MPFAGLPILNEFHIKMDAQLYDLAARLQRIGGLHSMETGKKKIPGDGSQEEMLVQLSSSM